MSPLVILFVRMILTLIIVSLIARWFVSPRLSGMPAERAVVPLVLVHNFRYVLLAVFVPPVVDSMAPGEGTSLMAYGDLASALLALLAVLALKFRWPGRLARRGSSVSSASRTSSTPSHGSSWTSCTPIIRAPCGSS